MAMEIGNLFAGFILVLVGIVLVPVIQAAANEAGVSGSTGIILYLIPLLFILSIVGIQAKQLF